jgi:uncharacterized protein YecE (DUF72 family)
VGGWTYEPWRGLFFPEKLPKTRELEYAAQRLTTIEINGTYYRTQTPAVFAKWRDETPDNFVFSVKALRFCTNRRVLAEAGDSVGKFLSSGLTELGLKLGPILWQFAPTKRFEPDDFGAFLAALPREQDGVPLRHAIEVRHHSFATPEFVELSRKHGVGAVFAESEQFPAIADPTADFVYARLQGSRAEIETGYPSDELDRWVGIARTWAEGGEPGELPHLSPQTAPKQPRDVFLFFISGAKERNPAAAVGLIERLKA